MWELNPFSVQWDQRGISTRAAPKRCCSGCWTELKWWNFNWNHFIPRQNKHWNQKQLKQKIGLKSSKQMRTSAGESRDALWGHVYNFGFQSLDHLIPFLCSQIPDLNLPLTQPQNPPGPQNLTPPPQIPQHPPCCRPGWAFLAPKRGGEKKNKKKSCQIQKISPVLPPPHFLTASRAEIATFPEQGCSPGHGRLAVCLSVCSSRGCGLRRIPGFAAGVGITPLRCWGDRVRKCKILTGRGYNVRGGRWEWKNVFKRGK